MNAKPKKQVTYTKAAIAPKVKAGGKLVVSEALVKQGATNLIPKVHVKRGDTVMLMNGPKKTDKKRSAEETRRLQERNAFKGTIGKIAAVFPKEAKIVIEGVNMMTNFIKPRAAGGESGIIRKEAPIFASRVMLYDAEKKRPLRASKRKEASL